SDTSVAATTGSTGAASGATVMSTRDVEILGGDLVRDAERLARRVAEQVRVRLADRHERWLVEDDAPARGARRESRAGEPDGDRARRVGEHPDPTVRPSVAAGEELPDARVAIRIRHRLRATAV